MFVSRQPKNNFRYSSCGVRLQLAFSKIKVPWQNTTFVSIHGRDSTKLVEALKSKTPSLVIITDSNNKGLEIIQQNVCCKVSYIRM